MRKGTKNEVNFNLFNDVFSVILAWNMLGFADCLLEVS